MVRHTQCGTQVTASHVAHCSYLDQANNNKFGFYPSQPIYVATANSYLQKYNEVLILCIRHLVVFLAQYHTKMRCVGKFVSRIILLCAIDRTDVDVKAAKHKTVADSGQNVQENKSFPKPFPVAKLLKTLTGLPENEVALGSLIDPLHKQKLLAEGMVFWNHFIESKSTITPASPSWTRGAAIHCPTNHHHHEFFQKLLPIYFNKKLADVYLDLANISFCAIHLQYPNKNLRKFENIHGRIFDNQASHINTNNPYQHWEVTFSVILLL
jgi:hypothetical protein